ncbi:MAG TPA: hypothetical protein DHU26_07740 [Spirochaetaceae bacterium]|jgi:hypothetical protein|uniref:transposase n=1 Tax=Rectinema subterraneum TaxID=2653714 RepID=UPI000EDEBA6D|nr:hypothetical protein [Rectinema subterraneum]HCX96846.1 hypothetical protein [Spirochaetaceae bacterium]
MLWVIEAHIPPFEKVHSRLGRPSYDAYPFFRAFLAQSFFRISPLGGLRARLCVDHNLRQICGFTAMPSLASFSRRFAEYASLALADQPLQKMVQNYHEGKVVGHVSRDSTAIAAE